MVNSFDGAAARKFARMLTGVALLALLGLTGCATRPPEGMLAVTPFDLSRYLGKWYEIARLDHSFERGLSDVSASYRLRADGSVEVVNRGYDAERGKWKEATGRAVFTGEPTRASLKVSFFGPFYGGYHVIGLDADYRWAMVVGPDRGYLWILSREKALPPGVRERLIEQARTQGIDVDQLIWVRQTRNDG